MSDAPKPAMKVIPPHGTPARYRGGRRKDGSEWDACRCRKCQARHSADYQSAKSRREGRDGSAVLALVAGVDGEAPGGQSDAGDPVAGEAEAGVRAQLAKIDAARPWHGALSAMAIQLAREMDRNVLTSVSPASKELREVLALLQPFEHGDDDDDEDVFDDADDDAQDWAGN